MNYSTEEIGAMLEAAMASADGGTIVLDVDSPGGTVYGVPELAAQIFAARAVKRIVASCSGMCCSAAYWLASAADEITASPSSEVGSIGVYSAHVDTSAAQSQAGMKVSIFSAGKYKAEGAMGQPLSEGARAAEQARVDEMYGVFVADVARGRGTDSTRVRSGFGEGRVVSSQRAVTLGMIDRVATLAATIGRFRRPNRGTGTGASADTLRRQLALNVAKTKVTAGTPAPHSTGANADTLRRKLAVDTGRAAPTGANAATLLRKLRLDTAKVGR